MPAEWELSVSGFANFTCAQCTNHNGTFTLAHTILCEFQYVSSSSNGCAGGWFYTLNYSAGGGGVWSVELTWPFVPAPIWTLAAGSFDCLGVNVLTLATSPLLCAAFPGTVTLAPA